jgi:hypothetical protein
MLASHRDSIATSVNKMLAESGALAHFKNLSNPLYGTPQSVTASHTAFAIKVPDPVPLSPHQAAGAKFHW